MNPLWLLFLLPLITSVVIHFILKQKYASIAAVIGTGTTGVTLVIALMWLNGSFSETPSFDWIKAGAFELEIGFVSDQLAKGMMIVVCGIGFLVHVFSLGYMKTDESKARYFGNLSLFMFSMTGIVLASNFIMMFIFWELVGLSSYLLIGHWYKKATAAEAAKKAFLSNRIGDFGFLIGILMLAGITGFFTFDKMAGNFIASEGVLMAAVLLVFCGAIGKSAQLPLHIWLPDAMEGPTPVSALIHAATMVAAGVYMMARFFFSIELDSVPGAQVIAWIGGITSLVAALMATQQNDIKKILAYSTLSQLGYMVMAVGLMAPEAGMFHLFTHAWFKALLFLGSGAVIYACHHEQNIWKMGGLLKKMPITAYTFLFGTLSLTAIPFTSGFFSKEGILVAAKDSPLLYIAVGVAALTTFYMFRLWFIAFCGEARDHGAEEAKEVSPIMWAPLALLAVLAALSPWFSNFFPTNNVSKIHVSPSIHWTDPLVLMSLGAFLIGFMLALMLYKGKDKDPINIPLFANKFYIDEFYAGIVKWFQDIIAAVVHFLDEFIINGMIVGGLTRTAQGFGNLFRKHIQSGNLQHYAFLSGIGIILVIYFTVFH